MERALEESEQARKILAAENAVLVAEIAEPDVAMSMPKVRCRSSDSRIALPGRGISGEEACLREARA